MPAQRFVGILLSSVMLALGATAGYAPSAGGTVAWAPSSTLLVTEVMTGGVSASDEFVEIENVATTPVDLSGLEVFYVSGSGLTTTRKASWTSSFVVLPGQHLLLANAAGVYAAVADVTYAGGLAADAGVVVLRPVGGEVIDAVGWGTAANAFVEGTAAAAAPARSSIERRRDEATGALLETNDNVVDFAVRSIPTPEGLASPLDEHLPAPSVPEGSPSAGSSEQPATPPPGAPTPAVSASPTPAASPSGPVASAAPSASPTSPATAGPDPTPPPSTVATASPAASAPASSPSPSPTSPAPASAAPSVGTTLPPLVLIAAARSYPIGTKVGVTGVVTAVPPTVGDTDLLVIQDATAGVFVALPAGVAAPPAGTAVTVVGVLAAPYGQLEIRTLERLDVGPDGDLPPPMPLSLSDVGESVEGRVVTVTGRVTETAATDGRISVTIADGATTLRVYAADVTGLQREDFEVGATIEATGIVGQRATATGRLDGYRLWVRSAGDVVVTAAPETTPRPTATVKPSATPVKRTIASAIASTAGAVEIDAVVTAAAGLVSAGGPTIVVADATGAVAALLPAGAPAFSVGESVVVTGSMGSWNSGPRLRATSVVASGHGSPPAALVLASPPTAAVEWRLVQVAGTVEQVTHLGTRWRFVLRVGAGTATVMAEPAAGIDGGAVKKGAWMRATGIVRRSPSDASAFQVVPRAAGDVGFSVVGQTRSVASGRVAATRPAGTGAPAHVEIQDLVERVGQTVTVSGVIAEVSAASPMLDDGTGTVALVGEEAADELALLEAGDAIEVTGEVVRQADGSLALDVEEGTLIELAAVGRDAAPPDLGLEGSEPAAATTAAALGTNLFMTPGGSAGAAGIAIVGLLVVAIAVAAIATRWKPRAVRDAQSSRGGPGVTADATTFRDASAGAGASAAAHAERSRLDTLLGRFGTSRPAAGHARRPDIASRSAEGAPNGGEERP